MLDKIPDNWKPGETQDGRTETGSVELFRLVSDEDWQLSVYDTTGTDEGGPKFQIALLDEEMGLYHGHTADGIQELRGVVSAMTYMANHAGAEGE